MARCSGGDGDRAEFLRNSCLMSRSLLSGGDNKTRHLASICFLETQSSVHTTLI
jgi:hypothetical protein